jgi:hypothetical protein
LSDAGTWWNDLLAPSIIVVVVIAIIGWLRSYLSGKKSNIKEAQSLETQRADRAEAKDIKEKADAKLLELEKTTAATVLKKDAKEEAIEVKKSTNERMDNKFRFSDQEHASQHAELKNELKRLDTKIEQVSLDLKAFMKQQDDYNESCKNGDN